MTGQEASACKSEYNIGYFAVSSKKDNISQITSDIQSDIDLGSNIKDYIEPSVNTEMDDFVNHISIEIEHDLINHLIIDLYQDQIFTLAKCSNSSKKEDIKSIISNSRNELENTFNIGFAIRTHFKAINSYINQLCECILKQGMLTI